jgi:hypothetical protein
MLIDAGPLVRHSSDRREGLQTRLRVTITMRSLVSACFYGTMVYGEDKSGTKEKARPCPYGKRCSSRRAVAPL